jgi:hypothetical protein
VTDPWRRTCLHSRAESVLGLHWAEEYGLCQKPLWPGCPVVAAVPSILGLCHHDAGPGLAAVGNLGVERIRGSDNRCCNTGMLGSPYCSIGRGQGPGRLDVLTWGPAALVLEHCWV